MNTAVHDDMSAGPAFFYLLGQRDAVVVRQGSTEYGHVKVVGGALVDGLRVVLDGTDVIAGILQNHAAGAQHGTVIADRQNFWFAPGGGSIAGLVRHSRGVLQESCQCRH